MPTEFGKVIGLIRADEEDLLLFGERVGIDSHSEGDDFARATAELEKAFRISVVAVGQVSFEIANTVVVFSVRGGSILRF